MSKNGHILLIEDSEDDILMTQRALLKARLLNELVITRDGEQALEYLFGTGKYADRDTRTYLKINFTYPGLFVCHSRVDGNPVFSRCSGYPPSRV